MKVLACYSLKGGVGKTTAAVNLGYCAAQERRDVLIWDLDPQGAASYCLSIKTRIKGGSKDLIRGKRPLLKAIRETNCRGLDLLPADFSNRNLDLFLSKNARGRKRLADLLATLNKQYDLVLLDCAPSISAASESVFYAADALLVPLLPSRLSLRAYEQLVSFLQRKKYRDPQLVPYFSIVDPGNRRHNRAVAEFARNHPELLRSYVPYAEEMEQMVALRGPIGLVAGAAPAARAFRTLWQQIKLRIGEP
jgi:chromosome partitioning protein